MLKARFSILYTFRPRTCKNVFKNSFSPTDLLLKLNIKKINPVSQTHSLIGRLFSQVSQLSNDSSSKEVQNLANVVLDSNSSIDGDEFKDKAELLKVLKFLVSKGCTTQEIKEKCMKYINPQNSSYVKAFLISELSPDMSMLLPLMSLPLRSLRKAAMQARNDKSEIQGFPNRIAYLSHHLEKLPLDLIPDLAKHSSLLTMPFNRLELKMNILKNADISPEYIGKDLWIFNYNEKLLASRISAAAEAGVEMKPWMLRSSERTFESVLIKNASAKKILGDDDEITYLAKKLECSKEYVEYIMEKNKLLKAINIPKLEQILNFLYGKGYTAEEIRLFPRVFCSSVQTLSMRFDESTKRRESLPTISQLCMSSGRFKKTMEQHETNSAK